MPNTQNKEVVKELRSKIAEAKSVVFAEYHGLKANDINTLRDSLNKEGTEMTVAKNKLAKIALKEEGVASEELDKLLKGPTAFFFAKQDPISFLKPLFDFSKEKELPSIKGGIFDGKVTSAEGVKTLSELPSRDELLARVVGGMKSPITGIVNVLSGPKRSIVYALKAVANKKEGGA
ncbi:MAG: 50S ribosomal protein L10 [Patescibacteria group bacterium]|uniref:Large ribosomal subunit protein uL10 n=1 Tax=candidate division WWE3 bacterium TaxID=2053526 RepID=A0A955J270_UNCKA|nr:50S ribosomal protein L10 [candidate division WWE3 bacterium]